MFTARSGWKVSTDQSNIAKISAQHSSFKVTLFISVSIFYIIGFKSRQNRNSAITLFLGRKKVRTIPSRFNRNTIDIRFICFDLLQANDVSRIGIEPVYKSPFNGRSDSIYIV